MVIIHLPTHSHYIIPLLFGDRVRELRKNKDLTQQDLAAIMNTDKAYIGKVETGSIEIKLGTIVNLCKALDVTVKELFDFPY